MRGFSVLLVLLISFLVTSFQNSSTPFSVDTFDTKQIPDSLFGASCVYSKDTVNLNKNKIVLFEQIGGKYAVMSINHKLIYLRYVQSPDTASKYINNVYTVFVNSNEGKSIGEEAFKSTARVTIKNKKGQTVSLGLVGLCGD